MDVRASNIPDVKIITPRRFSDQRGWFSEVYNKRLLAAAGIEIDFVQDNQSYSAPRGTLRGLHFQKPPATQAKLTRVLHGSIVDVSVDCRVGSPTYGQYAMIELCAGRGDQVLCPHGFAHGILTLEPDTVITYKVDNYYAPQLDLGLRFDDPDVAIAWPLPIEDIVLSDKDRSLPWFRDLPPVFGYP